MNVIKRSNIPTKLPVFNTLTIIMALSFFHVPGWAWGVVLTITVLFWLAIIVKLLKEEEIDIFDNVDNVPVKNDIEVPHETNSGHKSKFMRSLQEAMNKKDRNN